MNEPLRDLPTREEAQRYLERYYGDLDAANWHYAKNAAFLLMRGRADGILQTRQELIDSFDREVMARTMFEQGLMSVDTETWENVPEWVRLEYRGHVKAVFDAALGEQS